MAVIGRSEIPEEFSVDQWLNGSAQPVNEPKAYKSNRDKMRWSLSPSSKLV